MKRKSKVTKLPERPIQCHSCQLKAGAQPPKDGLMGVTCTRGKCSGCGVTDLLIYPWDYNWPDTGEYAVWD